MPSRTSSETVQDALREAIARLEHAQALSAPLAAELLLMHALRCDRTYLYAHPEAPLNAAQSEHYASLIARRAGGVPTQYLIGHQEFWGLDFEVTPEVLIPRPETEHVIEVALARFGANAGARTAPNATRWRIADIGTGSGCIAIALAHELPNAQIVATDISAAALEVAKRNAARHGAESCIEFVNCNLLDVFHGPRFTSPETRLFDLIASNPPYIASRNAATLQREVRDHEPHEALFGGETGTETYPPLIAQAEKLLKADGFLVLEMGCDQEEQIRSLLSAPLWDDVVVTNDLAGLPRIISARRTAN